ncbi:putative flippase GtrA [Marmoricola sp. OAE513]|uniref:GtrA family protein n=1 Tax=Marmoricola sp. OAE513 TaxID=2817894 RepID=UPI001AE991A3
MTALEHGLRRTAGTFAVVGVINTIIDFGLFALLHDPLGITLGNLLSTAAGMTFSFVVNGLVTFKAERLTLRHALTFIGTTGTVLWVVQPIAIHLLLGVLPHDLPVDRVLVAKACTIGISFVLNFAAYRWVVWPLEKKTSP